MKNHKEMNQSLHSKDNEHQEKNRRICSVRYIAPMLACFCICAVIGFGYWNHIRKLPDITLQTDAVDEPANEVSDKTEVSENDSAPNAKYKDEPASESRTERLTTTASEKTHVVTTYSTGTSTANLTEKTTVYQTKTNTSTTTQTVTSTQSAATTEEIHAPITIQTPPDFYSYTFDSYKTLFKALIKQDHFFTADSNNYGELFNRTVSAFANNNVDLYVPAVNGNMCTLREKEGFSNITFMTAELYDLPWILYHCRVDDNDIDIKIAYYSVIGMDELNSEKSYCETLNLIAPDAPNPNNFTQFGSYLNIYESEISLANEKNVTAMISELKNSSKAYIMFNYDGMLVSVYTDQNMLPESFWASFSLERYPF